MRRKDATISREAFWTAEAPAAAFEARKLAGLAQGTITPVTRKILIAGLILIAAFLPLAVIPVAVVFIDAPVFVEDVVPFAGTNAPSAALLALVSFRAPPSH
jgi:hypothetical protein